jgi:octaprenyl-diphosphate synthase
VQPEVEQLRASTGPRSEFPDGFHAILDATRPRLEQVEAVIAERLARGPAPVQEAAAYVLDSGGKRLRPALLLVAARALGHQGDRDIRYAAVIEMIHTATLVHDDIIDHSAVRRGRTTANQRWGDQFTVLLGDWLYLRAIELALEMDDIVAMRALSRVTTEMTEGEIVGLQLQRRLDVTRDQYLDVARRKTAELFCAAASLPTCFAPGLGRHRDALETFGRNLGICFQIVDDLLDITGSETRLGKPVFSDLREGKLTLPFILLLERASAADSLLISDALTTGALSADHELELRALLEHHGVLDETKEIGRTYGVAASEALAQLPPSPERDALALAPGFVLDRQH